MTEYTESLKLSLDEANAVNSMMATGGWKILDKRMKDLLQSDIAKLKKETDYNKILKLQANIEAIERLYQSIDSVVKQGNQAEADLNKYI